MHPKLIGTQVGPVEFSKLGFNNLTYPKAQSILSTSEQNYLEFHTHLKHDFQVYHKDYKERKAYV